MNPLSKFPRITSMLIGLAVGFSIGLVMVGMNNSWSSASIEEFKAIAKSRELLWQETDSRRKTTINQLSKVNATLKQKISKVKIIEVDGTITERENIESDSTKKSETTIRTEIEAEFKQEIQKQKETYQAQINKLENKKLRLGIGITSKLDFYGHGGYSILDFGYINSKPPLFLLGIGTAL